MIHSEVVIHEGDTPCTFSVLYGGFVLSDVMIYFFPFYETGRSQT